MNSDSDYEYESEGEVYMVMDEKRVVNYSDLLEKISLCSETPLEKLGYLITHYDKLDREVANRNWDLLVGSYVARAHWRKWARLWFGRRDDYGRRVVDRKLVERGTLARIIYEREVSIPYRRIFLLTYLGRDIGVIAVEYLE